MTTDLKKFEAAFYACGDLLEKIQAATGYRYDSAELSLEMGQVEAAVCAYLDAAADDRVAVPEDLLKELLGWLPDLMGPLQVQRAQEAAERLREAAAA